MHARHHQGAGACAHTLSVFGSALAQSSIEESNANDMPAINQQQCRNPPVTAPLNPCLFDHMRGLKNGRGAAQPLLQKHGHCRTGNTSP